MMGRWRCFGVSVFLISALLGCHGEDIERLSESIQALNEENASLTARVSTLEKEPELHFVLSPLVIEVDEKMFRPRLRVQTTLSIDGDTIPEAMYVDVRLLVKVDKEMFESSTRQIFPVYQGKSTIDIQLPLPVHGLTLQDIDVNLNPMNWYAGQKIPPEKIIIR